VNEIFSVNARNYWRVLIGWLGRGELWVGRDALMGFRATRPIRHVFYYVISPLLGMRTAFDKSRFHRVIYEDKFERGFLSNALKSTKIPT
jgi:hypothetical protein